MLLELLRGFEVGFLLRFFTIFPKYSREINSEVAAPGGNPPGPEGGPVGGDGTAACVEDTIGFGLGVMDCFKSGAIFFKYSK